MIALYVLLALLLFLCLFYSLYLISKIEGEVNRLKVYIEYMDSGIDKFAECGKNLMELEKKLNETAYLLDIDEAALEKIVGYLRAKKTEDDLK